MLAVHRGHANLRAHRRLCYRKRNDTVQVIAFPREERMFFDVQHNVQVARRPTELPNLSSASKANPCAVFHARWNFGIHSALAQNAAISFAFRARIGDDASRPLARRTSPGDAEKSLLVANLSPTRAGAASRGAFSRSRARPVAILAGLVTTHRNPSLLAKERLFELERQVLAQIGAALNPAATASASPTTAKHIAEAEELSEDVAEILEDRRIETCTLPRSATQPSMPVAVIRGALVLISEHGIGFAHFLKLFFRVGIIRIAVRMKLQRQLSVRALKFHLSHGAADAQHFVEIAFCVRGQRNLSSNK